MPGDEERVLDRTRLHSATGGDRGLVRELLDMLDRELPDRMARLDRALEDGDTAAASEVAHKMRGAAAYTGAGRLDAAAAELKRRLDEGRDPYRAVETLRDRVDELLRALGGAAEPDQASSNST